MYCPKCGKVIADNASVCPSCGADLKSSPAEAVKAPKEANQKSVFASVGLVFTIISAVCLIISFLLGFIIKDRSSLAFNIFSTAFIIAALPFNIILLVRKISTKSSILNPLMTLVFIAIAFIFSLISFGSLTTFLVSSNYAPSFYISVVSMTVALEGAAIVFGIFATNNR